MLSSLIIYINNVLLISSSPGNTQFKNEGSFFFFCKFMIRHATGGPQICTQSLQPYVHWMDKGQETEVALPSAWTSQHLWSFMALPPIGQVPRLWLPHSLSSFCRMAQGAKGLLLLLHASLQNVVSWPCCMLPYRTWSAGLTAPHHEMNDCLCHISYVQCLECLFPRLMNSQAGFTHSS